LLLLFDHVALTQHCFSDRTDYCISRDLVQALEGRGDDPPVPTNSLPLTCWTDDSWRLAVMRLERILCLILNHNTAIT